MPRSVPSLERRRLRAYLLLILADIAAVATGFLVAGLLYLGEWPSEQALRQATLLIPLYLTIAAM